MTTFENRSAGTTYDDRDSNHERDNRSERDSHQQRAGLATAGDVMCTWNIAIYDYTLQVLKAQRQLTDSMLAAAAPMINLARDIMSPDTKEDRSANGQLDARSDQRHDGANRSRKNERYSDDDTAECNKNSADNNMSHDNTSDTSKTERTNTQAGESAKTRGPVAASASDRKRL